MPVENLDALRQSLTPGQRLLGLDVGAKTVGLALSDPSLTVASPMETLVRGKIGPLAEALQAIIAEQDVGGLVLGLPVGMDGNEGPACQSVRQFAANLDDRMGLPMAFWDERLSTAAVERFLVDEADMSRGRRARLIDKMAAAYILQGALDSL